MQLILHLGAHGTDEGLIASWIRRNRTALEAQGICAPDPDVFVLNVAQAIERDTDVDPLEREETLLRGLGASGARRRMVVSAPGLLSGRDTVISPDGFYVTGVARRLYALRTLFGRCKVTLLLAVRGSVGLLPQILPNDVDALVATLPMLDGETLPWAQLVGTIRRQMPQAQLVVWRHEDFSGAWPSVLARIVGPGRAVPCEGLLEFAKLGLSSAATVRLQHFLAANPAATASEIHHVAGSLAAEYGRAAQANLIADYPGWAQVTIERLAHGYVTEWGDLLGREGVTFYR